MLTDNKKWRDGITWFLRITVGAVFIFSGFVKAIDPWGTLYKVNDYLAAMSVSLWANLVLVGVFAMCALEFILGIFLIFGCFRRSTSVMLSIFMAVMLPLTLWIAISDPVSDCGCFGEAFIISNWATFGKNVLLAACVIWLDRFNHTAICLITPAFQWMAFVITAIFIVGIELIGFNYQPLIDFRSYKTGESLIDEETSGNESPQFIFIYEKNGEKKEFSEYDIIPTEEDGWVFVDRKEIDRIQDSGNKQTKNLRIYDKNGEEDETDIAINTTGNELIVMMPDLNQVSPATTWKLNSLYEWSVKKGIDMIAVVSGSPGEIEMWEDLSMASYPIYTADDTQIKEVVRGNPGVIYLEQGRIKWKNSLSGDRKSVV